MSTHSYDVVGNGDAGQARNAAVTPPFPRIVKARGAAPIVAGLGARVRTSSLAPARDVASKVESRQEVHREWVDAVSVLGDVMRIVRAEPAALRIQLRLDVQLPVPDLAVDAESMRLAILALLLYTLDEVAERAGDDGAVHVSLRPAGEMVEIAIRRATSFAVSEREAASISVARFETMSNGGALERTESADGQVCISTRWPAAR